MCRIIADLWRYCSKGWRIWHMWSYGVGGENAAGLELFHSDWRSKMMDHRVAVAVPPARWRESGRNIVLDSYSAVAIRTTSHVLAYVRHIEDIWRVSKQKNGDACSLKCSRIPSSCRSLIPLASQGPDADLHLEEYNLFNLSLWQTRVETIWSGFFVSPTKKRIFHNGFFQHVASVTLTNLAINMEITTSISRNTTKRAYLRANVSVNQHAHFSYIEKHRCFSS